MVNCSAKIVFNQQRVRKDGTVLLYLRVIVDRHKKDIDLKVHWPVEKFDKKNRRCLPLARGCQKHMDVNVMLADAEARAAEVFIQYRLKRLNITLTVFLREFHSNLNRQDFIAFFEQKILLRQKHKEIAHESVKDHRVTLNHLKAWKKKGLLFSEITSRTAQQFDAYLISKTNCKSINGRWGHHKNIKVYLSRAKEEGIPFINPYDFFKPKTEMGRFQPLTKDQFISLYEYYENPEILHSHKTVLRAFLFACFTGMRHSDIRRFSLEWIDGEFLQFKPYKTRKFGTIVRMPITKEAMSMLADEIQENDGKKIFRSFSEQVDNKYIDQVGKTLGIKMKMCFQVARETFATLYMEHDGKLEVLAAFMGHVTTKMSEKYVKIMDQRKKTERERISNFHKPAENTPIKKPG